MFRGDLQKYQCCVKGKLEGKPRETRKFPRQVPGRSRVFTPYNGGLFSTTLWDVQGLKKNGKVDFWRRVLLFSMIVFIYLFILLFLSDGKRPHSKSTFWDETLRVPIDFHVFRSLPFWNIFFPLVRTRCQMVFRSCPRFGGLLFCSVYKQ